ncbi:BON domain-containing protein [Phenylobacterium sp.]|uniref:BON domain-containing protein n=1 Tax=Phenylobacterium sp. TaxID=1871053 RepID=UPI0011FD70B5|nr:BON domain-containing protein [Phenylobacterium sp.]THD54874.1 MAG: BON domain-containing protein [Phenylobacterium sp.]
MAREDWQDREEDRRRMALRGGERGDFGQADYSGDYGYDPAARSGYRVEDSVQPASNDYGQADYSTDYAYDPARGEAYRRESGPDRDYGRRMDSGDYRPLGQPRSWMDKAGDFFSPGPRAPRVDTHAPRPRRGPSDRVLWAVILERLEDQRGLDLRDLEVVVDDAEVTLNGTVRHKADKRRIEDIADIDGVRHVQNNLRLREHGHWTFL